MKVNRKLKKVYKIIATDALDYVKSKESQGKKEAIGSSVMERLLRGDTVCDWYIRVHQWSLFLDKHGVAHEIKSVGPLASPIGEKDVNALDYQAIKLIGV